MYINHSNEESNEEWSSQLWKQFIQLRKKPEKKSWLKRDFIVGSIITRTITMNVLLIQPWATESASDKISYMNKFTHVMAWNYSGKP